MKLVKEYINFERGLDPKDAMKIGMEELLNNYLQSIHQTTKSDVIKLEICAAEGKNEFVRYLINKGVNIHFDNDKALLLAVIRNNISTVEILLNAGANPSKIDVDSSFAKNSTNSEIIKLLKDFTPNLKEYNFERGLDPKHAMRIGEHNIEYKLKKYYNYVASTNLFKMSFFSFPGFSFESYKKIGLDGSFCNNDNHRGEKGQFTIEYNESENEFFIVFDNNGWANTVKSLRDIKNFLGLEQMNETINFEKGLDPKRAMGIGNTWETLHAGNALQLLNTLPNLGYTPGMIFTIDKLFLDERPYGSINFCKTIYKNKEDFIKNKYMNKSTWEISKKFFQENFKVIK